MREMFETKEYIEVLKNVELFQGIEMEELMPMLSYFQVKERRFSKNQIIFSAGDSINAMGIILSGSVQIIHEDFLGNRLILATFTKGELFGEVFSCAKIDKIPVTVIAMEDTCVLFLDYHTLISLDTSLLAQKRLIENMISIIAMKNVILNHKIEIMSKRTLRDKIIAFLEHEIRKHNSFDFYITFDRQELADFLCVDRSALSKELSKMREEDIIRFKKNHFHILKQFKQ